MNRFRLILLIFIVAANTLVFTACKDDVKDTLTVTPTKLYFAAFTTDGQQVRIDTNNKDWSVVPSSENWISVSNKREDGFTVSVSGNTTTAERTGTVTVKAGKAEEVITVTQDPGGNYTLSIDPKSITFAANETQTKNVNITTNAGSWNITPSIEWLSLEKQGVTLKVTPKTLNLGSKSRQATINITAGNASATLQVTQEVSDAPIIKFDRADAYYYGDYYETSMASYDIVLMNNNSFVIFECFSTLLPDGADLKLDVGTYIYDTETGDAKTFLGGVYIDDQNEIEITGGSFTLALLKDVYTLKADFSGEDEKGNKYPSLRFEFSGKIFFEDETPMPEVEFTDIPESGTYTAKGIPSWFLDDPGPETWTGSFVAHDDENGQYYAFENFEDIDWFYFCNFKDGSIFINGTKPLGGDDKYDIYFRAGCIDEDDELWLYSPDTEIPVRYYSSTGILDFGFQFVEEDGMRFTGVVGFFVVERATKKVVDLFTDLYANLKYQLTPVVAPTSKITKKSVLQNKRTISRFKSKSPIGAVNIIKVDKSKMTKIPKSQLQVLDKKSFQRSIKKNK